MGKFTFNECKHKWIKVGIERRNALQINVISFCESCSSYTYHEADFIGWKLESLEDRLEK